MARKASTSRFGWPATSFGGVVVPPLSICAFAAATESARPLWYFTNVRFGF